MSTSIHLDELIGLCDEISILSKVGLPLEKCLSSKRKSSQKECLRQMAHELETGTSLADLVRRDPAFPPFYAVVIEAGLASGNLSGVLNTVADSARQIRDVRLFVLRAILYPIVLLTVLWFLFIGLLTFLSPIYASFCDAMDLPFISKRFENWGNVYSQYWLFIVWGLPVCVWGIYWFWGFCTKRGNIFGSSCLLFRFIPMLGTVVSELQKMVFIRNLSLLLDASVPLDQAISLASQSCCVTEKKFPQLIQWVKGMNGSNLKQGLQFVANNAQLRADLAKSRCEMLFPAFVTILVAVALGFAYFVVVLWPYFQLLHHLSNPFMK